MISGCDRTPHNVKMGLDPWAVDCQITHNATYQLLCVPIWKLLAQNRDDLCETKVV